MKLLVEWFPLTLFDWEEVLLGLGVNFCRKELDSFNAEHWGLDLEMAKLIHGAFLAALYEGKDLKMDLEYPIVMAGKKIARKIDGKVVMSEKQCVTSPIERLTFSINGPVIETLSGSQYLLLGENLAWSTYPYLKGQEERPDLIEHIFSIV